MIITHDGSYSVSAHHNTAQEYDQANHINEVKPDKKVVLCVDAAQMGLGGASCGPRPMAQYRLSPETLTIHYVICPVEHGSDDELRTQGRIQLPLTPEPTITSQVIPVKTQGMMKKSRQVTLASADGTELYYWFDSIKNMNQARKYNQPFVFDRSGTVYARTVNPEGIPSVPVSMDFDKFYDLKKVSKRKWKIVSADSFQPNEGEPEKAIDGRNNTYWHTNWTSTREKYPHEIQIDLSQELKLVGIKYLGRQGSVNGRISKYRIQTSTNGKQWSDAVQGQFSNDSNWQRALFEQPIYTRYIKVIALSEVTGQYFASIAELDVMALNE